MSKYLGPTGLIYLWNKIKNYVAKSITDLHLGDTYVAKESGKGLSTNDYTTAEKNKLSGIATGAEVNVQSNWAESNSSADSFIQNKPTIPSKTSDLTNDSGFITSADVPEGAAASSTTPLMDGTASVGSETAFARGDHRHPSDTSKQDTISDLATIRSGAGLGATAYQKPSGGIPATDMASAVQTSLGLANSAVQSGDLSSYAPKASPALTGTPTAPTASASTNTTQIATTAFVQSAISAKIAGVASFQGDATSFSQILGTNFKEGWYWVIKTAGTYAGEVCEPGDMIFALESYLDYDSEEPNAAFTVIQTNLDIQEMTTAEMDTATDNWA